MKSARLLLATLLLAGSFVATGTVNASAGVITQDEFTPGSYCQMEFPAMQENSPGTNHPTLKSATSGDVIDFYGRPCNENPNGQDQVDAQKLDLQHSHYND